MKFLENSSMLIPSCIGLTLMHPHPIQLLYSNIRQLCRFKSKCYGGIIRFKSNYQYEYLIVKGRHTGIWSFPKGHSKKNETSLECAHREIAEETGITYLPHFHNYLKAGGAHYYVFDVSEKYDIHPQDSNEISEGKWVTLHDLSSLHTNAGIQQYIKRLYRNQC
jgi:8-oxo-dGTP diphosphatase